MKWLFSIFILCMAGRIVDGDTFHAICNGEDVTIRLLAANTPEITRGHHDCYGEEAKTYLSWMIASREVRLEFEGDKPTTGVFHRTLAYVFVDGKMVNLELIKNGYAKDYTYKYKTKRYSPEIFHDAEKYAKNNQLGLWKYCKQEK
jgi:micrococcal nuclease